MPVLSNISLIILNKTSQNKLYSKSAPFLRCHKDKHFPITITLALSYLPNVPQTRLTCKQTIHKGLDKHWPLDIGQICSKPVLECFEVAKPYGSRKICMFDGD